MSDGFDDLADRLDEMRKGAKKYESGQEVSFEELFPPIFMQQYTDFGTMDEFLEQSPWNVETNEDFEQIPEDEFDQYVQSNSKFESWEDMLGKAGTEQISRDMGF